MAQNMKLSMKSTAENPGTNPISRRTNLRRSKSFSDLNRAGPSQLSLKRQATAFISQIPPKMAKTNLTATTSSTRPKLQQPSTAVPTVGRTTKPIVVTKKPLTTINRKLPATTSSNGSSTAKTTNSAAAAKKEILDKNKEIENLKVINDEITKRNIELEANQKSLAKTYRETTIQLQATKDEAKMFKEKYEATNEKNETINLKVKNLQTENDSYKLEINDFNELKAKKKSLEKTLRETNLLWELETVFFLCYISPMFCNTRF